MGWPCPPPREARRAAVVPPRSLTLVREVVLAVFREAKKTGCFGPVASVLFAEGSLQVSLLYREVQSVDEKEESH